MTHCETGAPASSAQFTHWCSLLTLFKSRIFSSSFYFYFHVASALLHMVGCKDQHDIEWAACTGFTLLLYSCSGFWPHNADYTPLFSHEGFMHCVLQKQSDVGVEGGMHVPNSLCFYTPPCSLLNIPPPCFITEIFLIC